MTNPHPRTAPVFAPNAAMAATGPGCGGISPCITDKKDNNGIASSKNGRLVSLESVIKTGSNNSSPTANHVTKPTDTARAATHQPTRCGPKKALNRSANTCAAPDSANSFPNIAPNAITAAIPPMVAPSPS